MRKGRRRVWLPRPQNKVSRKQITREIVSINSHDLGLQNKEAWMLARYYTRMIATTSRSGRWMEVLEECEAGFIKSRNDDSDCWRYPLWQYMVVLARSTQWERGTGRLRVQGWVWLDNSR